MMTIDFDAINRIALNRFETLLEQFIPGGKRVNGEYVAKNPRRKDKTAGSFSINIAKGVWKDFADSNVGGSDPVSLWAYLFGTVNQADAARILANHIGAPELAGVVHEKQTKAQDWTPVIPVPEYASAPPDIKRVKNEATEKWDSLPIVARWAYRTETGELIGYACRVQLPDGGKDVVPQSYCRNADGESAWKFKSFTKPRPLYNLPDLCSRKNRPVVIVEGEKTADAAANLLHNSVVTTWPGGSNAVEYVDTAPLQGRKVVIWPDNDAAGFGAAKVWAKRLKNVAASVAIVTPPEWAGDGWDLADEAPEGFSAADWIKNNQHDPDDMPKPLDDKPAPQSPETAEPAKTPEDTQSKPTQRAGFTILGYDRESIFVFPYEAKQIKTIGKSDMTENGMLALAPLEYWMDRYPTKSGFNKTDAANDLFRIAYERGVFNPDRIRGRGAWRDDSRVIFHMGDRLHVDGEYHDMAAIKSHYIYQAERPFPRFDDVPPLTSEEGEDLLSLAQSFRWTVPASAALLVGWCVLAPLCGALQWRPHIWITGGPGSGKSTIVNQFVNQLTGHHALFAQGNSSEAGIRQALRGDAMPVLVDESEQNGERETQRMQAVLSLIRQSSSESGAKTYKGTVGGSGMQFHIRSMFCLASIQVGIQQQADRERLTVLSLREKSESTKDDPNQWLRIKDALYNIERDTSYSRRMLRRTVGMMPVLLESIDVFVKVAASYFGNQRTGDQYGTLLAGAWCLTSIRAPSEDEARESIASFDWNEYTESSKISDPDRAMRTLMDTRIRSQYGMEYTVFEVVDRIADLLGVLRETTDIPACQLDQASCQSLLQRYGMKVIRNNLNLATNSESLAKIFVNTPFSADFKALLSRVPCVSKSNEPAWIAGKTTKCLIIPLSDLV